MLFQAFCAIGLAWQVVHLANSYFEYNVLTALILETPLRQDVKSLSFCGYYPDLVKQRSNSKTQKDYRVQSNLTLAQILERSPPVTQIFDKCYVRSGHSFVNKSNLECTEFFIVEKFFHQSFVCYMFSTKSFKPNFRTDTASFAINFPGAMYSIELDYKLFANVTQLKAILTSGRYPEQSSAFTPVITRSFDIDSNSFQDSMFRIRSYSVSNLRLPSPYVTKCRNYQAEGYNQVRGCINSCLEKKTLQQLNRIHFSPISVKPVDVKPIGIADMANSTFRSILSVIDTLCEDKCSRQDCNQMYSVTMVEASPTEEKLILSAEVTRDVSYQLICRPYLKLNDFVLYVSSCFGTWLGLSLMSFNIFALLDRTSSSRMRVNSVLKPDLIETAKTISNINGQLQVLMSEVALIKYQADLQSVRGLQKRPVQTRLLFRAYH